MDINLFKAFVCSLNKEINRLEEKRKELIKHMESEHPINRLHDKLVTIKGCKDPEYFDKFYISNYTGSMLFANVYCYNPKKDGSMSKAYRVHYCSFDNIEDEIKEYKQQ